MGGKIKRINERTIVIEGVKKLLGVDYEIMPDRNEVVTFAIGALVTKGEVIIEGVQEQYLHSFFSKLNDIQAGFAHLGENRTRFYYKKNMIATGVVTACYPGFMTDWQAPWTVLMTQVKGVSTVHETIYEERFGYIKELLKMGARIKFFDPKIKNPSSFYNFNWRDAVCNHYHAVSITGPNKLHNAMLEVTDLRAGATLILGALSAQGQSVIVGVDHIDRGYEFIEKKFSSLGAKIKRVRE
jgi:UDP-N-acetylglucosamine 1-carboxyvinyltransferase